MTIISFDREAYADFQWKIKNRRGLVASGRLTQLISGAKLEISGNSAAIGSRRVAFPLWSRLTENCT